MDDKDIIIKILEDQRNSALTQLVLAQVEIQKLTTKLSEASLSEAELTPTIKE